MYMVIVQNENREDPTSIAKFLYPFVWSLLNQWCRRHVKRTTIIKLTNSFHVCHKQEIFLLFFGFGYVFRLFLNEKFFLCSKNVKYDRATNKVIWTRVYAYMKVKSKYSLNMPKKNNTDTLYGTNFSSFNFSCTDREYKVLKSVNWLI